MLSDLTGHIERVTYTNEENGYTVARLKVSGRRDLVTVIGHLASPRPGEVIKAKGEWSTHPKYGEQFKIIQYETVVPASVAGMEKYLGSGFIKGIGPVMAKRLVAEFGPQTLEVIDTQSDKLLSVEGIGPKRLEMIRTAWGAQKQIRDLILFLQTHDISAAYAVKIFKQYGSQAVPIIRDNPYQLAEDIFGIGFLTADRMAAKLGLARDSDLRCEAGVMHMLHRLSNAGHVFCPQDELVEHCRELLGVEPPLIAAALDRLAFQQRLIREQLPDKGKKELSTITAVYLAGFHVAETGAASRLRLLAAIPGNLRQMDVESALTWVQERLSLTLAPRQTEAVRAALTHKVLVITGGPGTGKTTIVRAITTIMARLGARIVLAAPTGRAAKRLSESSGLPAKTVHRLLEFSYPRGSFQVNEQRPLDADLIVVDEASMIDVLLMHHLLKAVPRGAVLILVGDVNQLPSVGPGNVLGDIIASGTVPVVELTEIFRQAAGSLIIVNAHRINQGHMPHFKHPQSQTGDFFFIEQDDPEKALEVVLDLVSRRLPVHFGFDPVEDIQVLTPMHRGVVGVAHLNQQLQELLNPRPVALTRAGRHFKVADKVMQVRNNYDKGVFNGDIGRIASLDHELQEAVVTFEGRPVGYDYSDLDELMPAYATSVHKSQGSEYPAVVLPLVTQHYMLLQRNLLYTAVTRGKRLVVIVGSKRALGLAVKNDKTQRRYTGLRTRLEMR